MSCHRTWLMAARLAVQCRRRGYAVRVVRTGRVAGYPWECVGVPAYMLY